MMNKIYWFLGAVTLLMIHSWYMDRSMSELKSSLKEEMQKSSAQHNQPTTTKTRLVHAGLDRDTLRSEIRSALAEQSGALSVTSDDTFADEEGEAPVLDEEAIVAFDLATTALETGMQDGVWTMDDRHALGSQMGKLDQASRREIMEKLYTSLNNGELKMEGYVGSPI